MADLRSMLDAALQESVREKTPIEQLFVEEPVPLDVFFSDRQFLGNVGHSLSPIQENLVRHAERVYLPETYPLLAEEFDPRRPGFHVGYKTVWRDKPYWGENVSMKNLLNVTCGKGCVCEGTGIYDPLSGLWRRVESLEEPKPSRWADIDEETLVEHGVVTPPSFDHHTVLALDPDEESKKPGALVPKQASPTFVRGQGPCLKIQFSSGNVMRVFTSHQYYVQRGDTREWMEAKRVRKGDKVAWACKLPCLEPVRQPQAMVVAAAVWLSQKGTVYAYKRGVTRAIPYSDHDIAQLYQDATGCKPVADAGNDTWVFADDCDELAEKTGLANRGRIRSTVPPWVYSLPDDQLALFLGMFFRLRGSFTTGHYGSKMRVETTVHQALAADLQRLLLRFGIMTDVVPLSATVYRLEVQRTFHVYLFAKHLAWPQRWKRKRDKALKDFARFEGRSDETDWNTVKVIQSAGVLPYWDMQVDDLHSYVAGGGAINHNSGKDMTCQVIAARVAHLCLCLRNPQRYFNIIDVSNIDIINVAPSADAAHSVFFRPLRMLIERSPWFQDKLAKDPLERSIVFNKQVILTSGHSQTGTLEGKNILLGVLDEVDEFPTPDPSRVGKKEASSSWRSIHNMLKTSGSTRFPQTYKTIAISWPRYKGSPIQQLVESAKMHVEEYGERSSMFYSGPYASWDVNPLYEGTERISVPTAPEPIPNVDGIVADFIGPSADPAMARAMYLCSPEHAVNPLFANQELVYQAFAPREVPAVQVRYRLIGGSWSVEFDFAPDFYPVQGAKYAIHVDFATVGDRSSFAMAHVASWEDHRTMRTVETDTGDLVDSEFIERRPTIKVDFVTSFSADKAATPPREIQLRWSKYLFTELKSRGFAIVRASADKYQSADFLQTLETFGVETEKFSTDTRDALAWNTVRDVVYDGRLRADENSMLIYELIRLNRLPNGRVDHPATASKDLADSFAGAIYGAIQTGGSEAAGGQRAHYIPASVERSDREDSLLPFDFGVSDLDWDGPANLDWGFHNDF